MLTNSFFLMEPQGEQQSTRSLKMKVGIFFGYNGESFLGLQYQRDTENTIENIMHKCLLQKGFILPSNAQSLQRIKWSRAGRTDKKVHALCNGISCSLEFGDRYMLDRVKREVDFDRAVKDINEGLPFEIRILTMKRCGKGFDMRHDAQTRVYNYIAPLKLFTPIESFKQGLPITDPEAIVAKLNELAANYLGTHSFHNFTKGYKTDDPRCDRYMLSMKAELVEQSTVDLYFRQKGDEQPAERLDCKFVRFTLVGQSFIYHQIRKMIGLLIKILSTEVDGQQIIKLALGKEKYEPYLAPGEGLYLNRMTFEGYNKKKEKQLQIEFTEEEEVKIVKYRAYLQSLILSHEIKEQVFTKWLLNRDSFKYLEDQEESLSEKQSKQ